MVAHTFLLARGVQLDTLLTFWLPLELAGFIALVAILYSEENWVLFIVIAYAAGLHIISAVEASPQFAPETDAIFGYQLVSNVIQTGHWTFGSGTGEASFYSYFPLMFVFTALWSGIGSVSPFIIINYLFPFVNLASLLTLRMVGTDLLNFSKRQSNLVLLFYTFAPTFQRVQGRFHYEAYAMVFFALVFLYSLKPKVSASEKVVAVVAILAITFSHYFTAFNLVLYAIVLCLAYLLLRGTRVQLDLLFMSIIAPLTIISALSMSFFVGQVGTIQNVFAHVKSLNALLSRLTSTAGNATPTYYPSLAFYYVTMVSNAVVILLGLLAICTFCVSSDRRTLFRISRKDALTYLAAAWIFSVMFAVAAYYGVVWGETSFGTLAGVGGIRSRVVEFAFLPFAIFTALGVSVILKKLNDRIRWNIGSFSKSRLIKLTLAVFLIVLFATSLVVESYGRVEYESSYRPYSYDEGLFVYDEAYYLGTWWNQASNHSTSFSYPFSGSPSLGPYIQGYGLQGWFPPMNTSLVQGPNGTSGPLGTYITVYYAFDTAQLQKPDHGFNETLNPQWLSSGKSDLNTIFNTGRIIVVYKPAGA